MKSYQIMDAHMYVWAIRNDDKQEKRQNKNRLIIKKRISDGNWMKNISLKYEATWRPID